MKMRKLAAGLSLGASGKLCNLRGFIHIENEPVEVIGASDQDASEIKTNQVALLLLQPCAVVLYTVKQDNV